MFTSTLGKGEITRGKDQRKNDRTREMHIQEYLVKSVTLIIFVLFCCFVFALFLFFCFCFLFFLILTFHQIIGLVGHLYKCLETTVLIAIFEVYLPTLRVVEWVALIRFLFGICGIINQH